MAPQVIGTLHYTEGQLYKAQKALVAAKFNGINIETKVFNPEKDLKKPDFVAKNPTGKVPFLETDRGSLFSSQSIARYIARCRADTPLFGRGFNEEGQIDTWLEFCTHELEVPLMIWVYPVLGLMEETPSATAEAQADVKRALTCLEQQLKTSCFLIGDVVTLADIVIICSLREGMALVFDDAFRKPFPKVCEWFRKCVEMPNFKAVVGDVALCKQAQRAAKFESPAGKEDKRGKASPKAAPKDAAKKEKASLGAAPAAAAPLSAEVEAKIKKVGDEIRELKAKFKAEGMSGKAIDKAPEVMGKVAELQALKAGAAAAPAIASSKQKVTAPAPGGDSDAQIKKASPKHEAKKKGKKGAEEAPGKELTPEEKAAARKALLKKVNKAGGKRGVEIEGAADMGGLGYFCTSVDEPDGDLEMMDQFMTAMNEKSDPTEEERKGGSGEIGKMIFSAGTDQLALLAYVPEAKKKECNAIEWLKQVLALHQGEMCPGATGTYAKGFVKADHNVNKFPLKMKEPSITEAISFLKKKGLFPDKEDDSDDDFVFGDDDFPS